MSRVYLPADLDTLRRLAAGESVRVEGFVAASTDEEDELAAVDAAAAEAPAVVVAELDDPDGPVHLDDVDALHAPVDASGDLAWFARQEVDAVIDLLAR